jgi:hypothetical protein
MSVEKIAELKEQRGKIEAEWQSIQQEVDKQVNAKLAEAGLQNLIPEARALLEKERQRLQSLADNLAGQIQALESVFGVAEDAADLDTDVHAVDDAVVEE